MELTITGWPLPSQQAVKGSSRPDLVVVGAGGQSPHGVGDVLGGKGGEAGADVGAHARQVMVRRFVLQRGMGPQAVGLHPQAIVETCWSAGVGAVEI